MQPKLRGACRPNKATIHRRQLPDEAAAHQELVAGRMREMLSLALPALPADAVHFLRGKPAAEIRNLAAELGTDLLVIGSHGHNPIRAVLGSTANAVLHGIHCDVLTVRV